MPRLQLPKRWKKNKGTEIVRRRLGPRQRLAQSALAAEPTKIMRVQSNIGQAVRGALTGAVFLCAAGIAMVAWPQIKKLFEENSSAPAVTIATSAAPAAPEPPKEILRKLDPLPPDPNWPPPLKPAPPPPVPAPPPSAAAKKERRLTTDCSVDYNPDTDDYTFGCEITAQAGVEPKIDMLKRSDFDKKFKQVRALVYFTLPGEVCRSDNDITIGLYDDKTFRQVPFTCAEGQPE